MGDGSGDVSCHQGRGARDNLETISNERRVLVQYRVNVRIVRFVLTVEYEVYYAEC